MGGMEEGEKEAGEVEVEEEEETTTGQDRGNEGGKQQRRDLVGLGVKWQWCGGAHCSLSPQGLPPSFFFF